MIGIGITTKDRPDLLDLTLTNILSHLPYVCEIVVSDDSVIEENKNKSIESCARFGVKRVDNSHNRGIARNKNSCLRELKDCDHIFLFDDDCYPIKDNWAEYVIDCHKESGVHHFNLLDKSHHQLISEKTYSNFTIEEYRLVGGVFMFLTKDVIEKVGAFNKDYDIYGYEHASYTYRVFKSGLHNGLGINLTIADLQDYIFSIDYACHSTSRHHQKFLDLESSLGKKFASSMTNQQEVKASIHNNQSIMAQDVNGPVFREL
jgi:glycosyltransferase involved in cell wall biosynthesis